MRSIARLLAEMAVWMTVPSAAVMYGDTITYLSQDIYAGGIGGFATGNGDTAFAGGPDYVFIPEFNPGLGTLEAASYSMSVNVTTLVWFSTGDFNPPENYTYTFITQADDPLSGNLLLATNVYSGTLYQSDNPAPIPFPTTTTIGDTGTIPASDLSAFIGPPSPGSLPETGSYVSSISPTVTLYGPALDPACEFCAFIVIAISDVQTTVDVTYTYNPVPEPRLIWIIGAGAIGMCIWRAASGSS